MDEFYRLFVGWEMGPLLMVSVIVMAGLAGGGVARLCRAPAITGNIVAGTLLGATLLKGANAAQALEPLSAFAMGLIALTVGGHFSYRRLHNALRRILCIVSLEVACAATLVFLTVKMLGGSWPAALLLAAFSVETAPATTVALIKENRAKGPFVKTLLGTVSIDSSLCIILFAFTERMVGDLSGASRFGVGMVLLHTGYQLLGSAAIGLLLGNVVERLIHRPQFHNFTTVFVAILVGTGLARHLGLSPLLSCLFLGGYLGNSSRAAEEQLRVLEPIELLLYTMFFTLGGAALRWEALAGGGLLCLAYIVARILGKGIGAALGGLLSGVSRRIWTNMAIGLVPQAGVAIGLVVLLEGDPRVSTDISALVGAVILGAVTLNEILGPLTTRLALRRAKEAGLDRPRLIEFLQEEFILPNLEAQDKWEAIRKLTDFFILTHNVEPDRRARLYRSVVEREKTMSTAVGVGAAIPHGIVDSGPGIQGVMGICREGIDFEAPDGIPVRLIVLIVTPKDHEKQHLEVLASLSAMISNDPVRERIIASIDANDAWEIIESEEVRDFNYFIEAGEEA